MSVTVDTERVDDILRTEWQGVLADDDRRYVNDESIRRRLSRLIHDDRRGVMTFKYMLLSNVLAKVAHPEIHYRAIQTKSELDGAFSSRTIADNVIVDWEQENGQRLGGSNEPGTSKPFRWAEVSMDIQVLRDDALELLYGLLEDLERATAVGTVDPKNVLRQTLAEIANRTRNTVEFSDPSAVPYRELETALSQYLETTGGGERLAAVAAGIVETVYAHTGASGWEVTADHVNVPDQQSNATGDIEISNDGDVVFAYEVKDKPVAENDIVDSAEKAQSHKLGEYVYLVGDGFADGQETRAKTAATDADIEMILTYPEEMITRLKFVGKDEREAFLGRVGQFLDGMRAQNQNRRDWEDVADRFS